ncbi:MAG: prolyl oligopeptidase family serine peptidase [Bacteroidota bacterium]
MNKSTHLLILFSIATSMLPAQTDSILQAYQAVTFTSESGTQLPYRVLWPKEYESTIDQNYPLVLFLHGAGERGDDNKKQLIHGSSLFLQQQDNFPAIVVVPQCATADYWAQMEQTEDGRVFNFGERPNPSLSAVMELLELLLAKERIDQDRVYLMGLSMGGMGTFELLARRPKTFAAAIPICGGTNPALLPIYAKNVPLWIFHGAEDAVVKVQQSRRVVDELKRLGFPPQYTEYPDVNHNSWDRAFAEEDLLRWLFSNKRQANK